MMRRVVTKKARYCTLLAPLVLVAGAAVAAGCSAGAGGTPPGSGGPASSNGPGGSGNQANAGSGGGSSGGTSVAPGGSGGAVGGGSSGGGMAAAGSSGAAMGAGSGGSGAAAPTCSPLASALQTDPTLSAGSAPLTRRLWRLSAVQYGNAIRDLVSLPQAPVLNSNGGTSDYAFFSDDSAVVDASLLYSAYQTTQTVLTQIAPQTLAACKTGETQVACATRFATSFGAQAFRRALDPSEVTALMAVYNTGAAQDFNTGIELMVQALFLSPSFFFRSELGPNTLVADATTGKYPDTTLTPYEVATQLAFLLTNTTPDATLLSAAASGGLSTSAAIASQVDRLLALDPVKQNINRIVVDWFNVRQLFSKQKDASFFTGLAAADQDPTVLDNDVFTSAQMYVNSVLWAPSGKVNDLLTSQQVFVNSRLAQLYGLTATGATATQFVAATDTHRSGILTQPAFLWSMSDPAATSIVKRGKFIHDDVICVDPGPGPGSILSDPAVQAKLAMLPTEIEKSNYRLMTQPCEGCHSQIDPYSLVLENFGPIGDYRTVADGVPVIATGIFSPPSPVPAGSIVGPAAFSKALADGKLLTSCGVQKMASYNLGRMIRIRATCEIADLDSKFEQTDGSISSLFRQVATADFMRARSGGSK